MAHTMSVVVEWEQADRQEQERSRTMLALLAEQVQKLPDDIVEKPVEMLFCGDEAALRECRTLAGAALADLAVFDVRFVTVERADYYHQKNLAVGQANGDLVVFLDCDALPESDWLGHLLEPFEDPEVSVVGGNTYVDPTDRVYNRTFALTWIFPLRSLTDEVRPLTRMCANNLAFRREVAERYPFPSMPETSRGSCQLLQNELTSRGVTMVNADAARVRHPPPLGPGQFFTRAFARGRDRLLFASPGRSRTLLGTGRRLRGDVVNMTRSLIAGRRRVDLSLATLPTAIAIAVTFSLCCSVAEILTMVNRDFMARHFRV